MTLGRWIKIPVRWLDAQHPRHPMAKGETACSQYAFIDLVGLARWREGNQLRRGQLRASLRFLATRWNWSTGRVSRFLRGLEEDGLICRYHDGTRQPTRITLCEYDRYQASPYANRDANRDANGDKEVEGIERNRQTAPFVDEIEQVFDLCNDLRIERLTRLDQPCRQLVLTEKRRRLVGDRLAEGFSFDDLKDAARGFYADTWQRRDEFLDPIHLFKNEETVRRHLLRHRNGKPAEPHVSLRSVLEDTR